MIKHKARTMMATWFAGLLALLPLLVTISLLGWAINILDSVVGPKSVVGQLFAWVGQTIVDNPIVGYFLGWIILLGAIYPLGIAVKSRLKKPLAALIDQTVRRIPVIGSLYDVADRFVSLIDQKEGGDIGAMSPVWCLFGGNGVAVLALMPNPEIIEIEGREYQAVLVPTAPVPIGGGLLYIPIEWIRPANIGVDKLTSVYMSMGITPPPSLVKVSETTPAFHPAPKDQVAHAPFR